MIHLQWLQQNVLRINICKTRSLIGSGFALLLWLSASAWASDYSGYNPPNPSAPTTATGSGSTRGCANSEAAFLTALAPESHVGRTVSTHPTLFWYVPDQESHAIELNLYELPAGRIPQLVKRIALSSTSGLMQYTLPQDEPALMPGRQYLWQVQIECEPDEPSSNVAVEVAFEVVPLSPELRTAIANASDRLRQAEQFAVAGIWYDALAAAIENRTNPYWLQLLNDLAELEPAGTPPTVSQRDRLQRLILVEQQSR